MPDGKRLSLKKNRIRRRIISGQNNPFPAVPPTATNPLEGSVTRGKEVESDLLHTPLTIILGPRVQRIDSPTVIAELTGKSQRYTPAGNLAHGMSEEEERNRGNHRTS